MKDLLMHIEKMFGNKHDYDAMIRTLYEVQQKEDKTVEEYMLCIQDTVTVIHRAYLEHLPDCGRDLKKDCLYHGLHPYLHDALSFVMAELPEREQAHPTFDTLYTLAKKQEAGQSVGHTITPPALTLTKVLPCADRKGGGPGGGGSGFSQSHLQRGVQVGSGGHGWYQHVQTSLSA